MIRRTVVERLTYANVMSSVAVFIALGGASYAAVTLPKDSVGSAQLRTGAVKAPDIAPGAVTSAKVRNGSLLAADFKPGQLATGAQGPAGQPGLTGPQGPKGDAGAQGLAGAAGPPGISEFQRIQVTHNVAPGDTSIITSASCPVGKKLLGGGAAVQDSKFHITFLNSQSNDVMALTAVVIPGQTITASSQAFVVANCAKVG